MIFGAILVALGVVYLVKPDIFNRWIWKRTSVTQRNMSPTQYTRYMRLLGLAIAALGAWLIYASL
jgi:hypothetical protein